MRKRNRIAIGCLIAFVLPANGGEADTLPRRPCDAQAAAMQPAPRLGAPVEYGSKDEALRTLAQAAAREGRPMQVDLLLDGRWQTFMAKPDGQVFVRREGTPPAPPRREVAAGLPLGYAAGQVAPVPQGYAAGSNTPVPRGYAPSTPRQEVAASAAPFRGPADGTFPENHQCPACGHVSAPNTGNWIIRGWNRDGSHEHWCERCGYRGRHRG